MMRSRLLLFFSVFSSVYGVEAGQSCDYATTFNSDEHPRLYITSNSLEDIKKKIHKGSLSAPWAHIKEIAGRDLETSGLKLEENTDNDNLRQLSDRIPYLLMAYLIAGDESAKNTARVIVDGFVGFDKWDSDNDLVASHAVFNLALYYDWMYNELDENYRRRLSSKIIHHANILHSELARGTIWWARDYSLLQNHNYVNVMAIAVAGAALYADTGRASVWLRDASQNFRRVFELLSPDGASHEGVAYWSYGLDALLKYMEAVGCTESPVGYDNAFLKNAISYRLQMTLPGFEKSANYSDSPDYDFKGPGHLLRLLASRYYDGRGVWLAANIEAARKDNYYSWLDLIWTAEDVRPIAPGVDTLRHTFDNMGIFVSRTGWAPDDSWLLFKVGPYQGKLAAGKGIYPGSHPHPDAGHVSLWDDGQWVLNDEGYSLMKRTEDHNTLIIDGRGQYGEGQKWFDRNAAYKHKAWAAIENVLQAADIIRVSANLTEMYKLPDRENSITRDVYVAHDGGLVVRDRIKGKPAAVSALFHSQLMVRKVAEDRFCLGDKFYIGVLSRTEVAATFERYAIPVANRRNDRGYYDGWLLRSELKSEPESEMIHVIAPAAEGCSADGFDMAYKGTAVTFSSGDTSWTVDLSSDKPGQVH